MERGSNPQAQEPGAHHIVDPNFDNLLPVVHVVHPGHMISLLVLLPSAFGPGLDHQADTTIVNRSVTQPQNPTQHFHTGGPFGGCDPTFNKKSTKYSNNSQVQFLQLLRPLHLQPNLQPRLGQ